MEPIINTQQNFKNGQYVRSGDDAIHARFYHDPALEKDMIEMLIPGDKHFQPRFEATEEFQHRFPQQWAAFQNMQDQTSGQTPLDAVAWMDEGRKDSLRAQHVHTLEQLAAVTDANLSGLGHGVRALREKAREELATKAKASAFDELKSENDDLRARLEALEKAAATPKKRGRPRKSA